MKVKVNSGGEEGGGFRGRRDDVFLRGYHTKEDERQQGEQGGS